MKDSSFSAEMSARKYNWDSFLLKPKSNAAGKLGSKKIPVTPSAIEHETFRLLAIISMIFNFSASKLWMYEYFVHWSIFLKIYDGIKPLLFNYCFVFSTDIDGKLFFNL